MSELISWNQNHAGGPPWEHGLSESEREALRQSEDHDPNYGRISELAKRIGESLEDMQNLPSPDLSYSVAELADMPPSHVQYLQGKGAISGVDAIEAQVQRAHSAMTQQRERIERREARRRLETEEPSMPGDPGFSEDEL